MGEVAVLDGDTLRLRGRVIRLSGIATPARGDCGGGTDCGASAAAALATLVRAEPVACAARETDPMGRPVARCAAGGTDLSGALVAAGWARAVSAEPGLAALEREARAARRGYWAGPAGRS